MSALSRIKRFVLAQAQGFHSIRRIETGIITRYLSPAKGETILDVGCGKGFYAEFLYRKGCIVSGIDPLEKDIAFAQKMVDPAVTLKLAHGEKIPFEKNSFDKVVSVCVMEHTASDVAVLRETHRVLKKNGLFVFSVDTLDSPYLPEKFKAHHRKEYHVNQTYTLEKITKMLTDEGFILTHHTYLFSSPLSSFILQVGSRFHYRAPFFLLFPLIYPALLIDYWLTAPLSKGMILVLRAEKK